MRSTINKDSPTYSARFVPSLVWLLPASLALAIGLTSAADWCELYPDSFFYLSVARHVSEYGELPQERLIAPPLFSTIISLFSMAENELPARGLRALFACSWAGFSGLTFVLYKNDLGRYRAGLAALLTATSGVLLTQTSWLLSENLFGPMFIVSLIAMQHAITGQKSTKGRAILAGFVCGACGLVRSVGIVLIPAGIVLMLLSTARSFKKRAAMALLFTTFALVPHTAWALRQNSLGTGYGYWHILLNPRPTEQADAGAVSLVVGRFIEFAPIRLGQIRDAILPAGLCWRAYQPPMRTVSAVLIGGVLLVLLVVRAVKKPSIPELTALFLLMLLCVWPWEESVRLVSCLIPIFLASLIWLWDRIAERVKSVPSARAALAACLAIGCLVHFSEIIVVREKLATRAPVIRERVMRMQNLAAWQRANIPEGQTVLFVAGRGAPSRLLAAGAGYFARRKVVFVDSGPHEPIAPDAGAYVIAPSESVALLRDVWRRHPRLAVEGLFWCGPA